jgi:hypothetical protein
MLMLEQDLRACRFVLYLSMSLPPPNERGSHDDGDEPTKKKSE